MPQGTASVLCNVVRWDCAPAPPHLSTCMEATTQGLQSDRFPGCLAERHYWALSCHSSHRCSRRQVAAQRRGRRFTSTSSILQLPSSPKSCPIQPRRHPCLLSHTSQSLAAPSPILLPAQNPTKSLPATPPNLQFYSVQVGRPPAQPIFSFSHPQQ